jgi:hypothetical protein
LGEGTTDQVLPFQLSIKVFLKPTSPAAVQYEFDTHDTPRSSLVNLGLGLGTVDQFGPVDISTSVSVGFPLR